MFSFTLPSAASAFLLVLPWPLLTTGILSGLGVANRYPRLIKRATTASAAFALLCAILALTTYANGLTGSIPWLSLPLPWGLGAFEIRVAVNPLSLAMALLVAFVGYAVVSFSVRYLDGDPGEGQFMRFMSLTLGFFFTMVVVDNLWAFFLSWVAKGIFLHRLLVFYPDRPRARLAARKKFFLHRISDAALLLAFIILARTLHTDRFSGLGAALSGLTTLPFPLGVAAGLLFLAVVLKSAQFPLQGWLIQVMEAPTPVSALMHAGLIYSGTFLFLRTTPLLSLATGFRDLLIANAMTTIVVAALAMMIASDIKGALAWSTSAQMGFMLLECGLGVYSVAVMHIIAHSLYKAHAFLSSGSVVEPFRGPDLTLSPILGGSPGRMFLALGTGIVMTLLSGELFGSDLLHAPALLLLGAILSVALARLLLSGLSARGGSGFPLLLPTAGLVALVSLATFALHRLFEFFLGGVLPSAPLPGTPFQMAILIAVAIVFLGLLWIEEILPLSGDRPFWKRLYVHIGAGLYSDFLLDRLLETRVAGTGPSNPYGQRLLSANKKTTHSREVLP
ncbi:MAG: proton-conducting transporter transmembrane domain-containing protein [Leptospirales bacterium]